MKYQRPRGTRDFLPKEMERREWMFSVIRKVFKKYGFGALETPAFESWDLLAKKGSAGEDLKKEIYYFKDKSDREMGLRFDLTVPNARVFAGSQLSKPFKRYQIGRVWRYDRPQAGRFREFWQADVDILGSKDVLADMEVIAACIACLKALGFRDFTVRINNRKVLDDLISGIGIKKQNFNVYRILDKLEKIGAENVKEELKGMGIDTKKIEKLMDAVSTSGSLGNVVKKLPNSEGVMELKKMVSLAKEYGIEKYILVDLSLVRGLAYYTGPIFEVATKNSSSSIAGGGRYDKLIELYGGNPTPATGISLGIDRIYEIMDSQNMFPNIDSKKVMVVPLDEKLIREAVRIANIIRDNGITTEIDVMGRSLKKNLDYANANGIPYVIIVGEKEAKQKKYVLKNMKKKTQEVLDIKDIISRLGQ